MTVAHAVRACLITNPRSGKGGIDLAPILPVLAAHGWQVDVRQKLHGGHATELARDAAAQGYDVVVACGGDGTVGEVVDGIAGSDIAVGVLPGGTANLWAHEIGVSMDLAEAALQLVGAQRRRVDVGYLTINGGQGQHFLLMAGLGIDAAVLSRLNKNLKGRIGMLAYLPAIGRALPQAKPFKATLDLDGVARQAEISQIVIGNTRRYASVTSVTPDALVDDGRLDVCVLTPTNPLSTARQISTLVLRKRPSPFSAVTDRVGQMTVRTTEVVPLQADGGRVKQKKVKVGEEGVIYEFRVKAEELSVLIPRDYNGEMFQRGAFAESTRHADDGTNKRGKSWYRVVAVGVDRITAARLHNGNVVTLIIDKKTRGENSLGEPEPMSTFLTSLGEGHLLKAKGKMDTKRATMIARRLRS